MTALVALAGCSAPSNEAPAPTFTATAPEGAEPLTQDEIETMQESPELSQAEKEAEYLLGMRRAMPVYGFPEYKLSDKKILEEGHKACDLGDDYKGDPMLNKVAGATGALVHESTFKLCPETL